MNARFVGAVSGLLAVVAGAFGAHALRDQLDPARLVVFETAARYQMFHALALVGVGLWRGQRDAPGLLAAAWAFTLGTVLFAGSLYAIAFTGVRALGAITPFGGLAFVVGWLALARAALSR